MVTVFEALKSKPVFGKQKNSGADPTLPGRCSQGCLRRMSALKDEGFGTLRIKGLGFRV